MELPMRTTQPYIAMTEIGMRDIRRDLQERLEVAESKYRRYEETYNRERQKLEIEFQQQRASFERERNALLAIIDIESIRGGGETELPFPPLPPPTGFRLPLGEFLITAIFTDGPLNKDDLREKAEAAGYFDDDESAGRKLHATLMNITTAGKVVKDGDGNYTFPTRRQAIPDASDPDDFG
ncbi:hypothetical protein ACMDCR_00300 [Labrys okinawensis]|uniref:hypothetical protein n=1 Tax=Labrys okinawensis TaxID=346911 RepID=UPI0039BC3B0C